MGNRTACFEPLESRLLLSSQPPDWRSLPVSILPAALLPTPAASGIPQDTAAYNLTGSSQQRSQFGLTGAGYSVAIIDTGIDYNNPAFAGRYLGGWDFVNNDADPMDDNGHGTHVAGIIGSADANYPGVATGVGIIALKVLDSSGSGSFGNVDAALQWVAAHQSQYHIAAVNMSLGSGNYATNPFTFLDDDLRTIEAEGVFVSAAAGNSYFTAGTPGLAFPAIDPLVVSVGAVWAADYGPAAWADGARDYSTTADQIVSFSQRSASMKLLAPGAFVTSTYLHDTYATLAGTSMAAPFVVGSAVIVRQVLDETGKPADPAAVLAALQVTGVSVTDVIPAAGSTESSAPQVDNVQHTGLMFKRVDVAAAVESIFPARTPNEQYVEGLYESILGRSSDASGLAYWSGQLDGGMPRGVLVDAIWSSEEHLAAEVRADYLSILGRDADAAGVVYWVRLMQTNGVTNSQVQRLFYASDEYFRKVQNGIH